MAAARMYRLNRAMLTRVRVSTGSTRARGSASIPPTPAACGASAGNACAPMDSPAISRIASQYDGIE